MFTNYKNSWGISTRLIGAVIMTHSDDKGLVLPPKLAENKLVIVPIIFEDSKRNILKEAEKIKKELQEYNPILDDREEYNAGYKFSEWELKGVPIRIEIGPKDIVKKQIILVRRDNYNKEIVKIKDLNKKIPKVLEDIQKNLFKKAKELLESNIVEVKNFEEFINAIKNKKLIKIKWCNTINCEEDIKNKIEGVKSINIPFEQKKITGKCFNCNKKAKVYGYFGKSY